MISCEQADFIDGTRRVMGTLTATEYALVREHALRCERSDWYHALPPMAYANVSNERARPYGG